ncbi:MAG TPA: prenyltransferase/squalene oxidase repeat-containing protein [Gemmataceae bacterium]|nr:prenyltransferase/squalene oxidase repeat-containing protein [Gemmataceae bacterium]
MSTNPEDKGRRRAIVALMVLPSEGISWMKIIPVWIASAVVNLAIVGLAALLFSLLTLQACTLPDTDSVETTRIVDQPNEEFDLTDDMIGMESGMPINLKVENVGDEFGPGMLDPRQAEGIPGDQPDTLRRDIPLPPGGSLGMGNGLPNPHTLPFIGSRSLSPGEGDNSLKTRFRTHGPNAIREWLEGQGGNKRSEATVARGLLWLALHQAPDGHWSLHDFHKYGREKPGGRIIGCNCEAGTTTRNDVAATGLGLLPFLGAGITHKPGKTTAKDYVKTVEGAVNWLIRNQGAKDGSYSGNMYAHGIATIAMCEAYGLTSDPRIKISAQRALNFIAYAQDNAGGGWRYSPKQAGDTSVTGWQLMALKSGQMAGLSVPRNTLKLADRFLDSVELSDKGSSMAGKTGGFGYTPGQPPTITMTAVGLLCREYSGVGPKNPALQKGIQRLRTAPPGKNNNIYYLYYATQVMHHMQGESWRFWNEGVTADGKKVHNGMRDTLISQQDNGKTPQHPHQIGSWGGSQGGRLMATSLSILCLEVYYRHLPLYRRDIATKKN